MFINIYYSILIDNDLVLKAATCLSLSLIDAYLTLLVFRDYKSLKRLRKQKRLALMFLSGSPLLHKKYRQQKTAI
jgi:hypothetical protein